MSMVRDPLFRVGEPAHNLIPAAGGAVWYPLHDSSLLVGIEGLPSPLVEIGTPSGAKWGTAGMYTLPAVNTDCALKVMDDDDDLFLDSQLSLYGMAVGQHLVVALEASYVAAPDAGSYLWSYGLNNSVATILGLSIDNAEAVKFASRGKDASTMLNTTLAAQSGTFAAFRNQGIFACVLGLRTVSSTEVDVEMRLGNGTLSAHYASSASVDLTANGASVPPGISGGTLAATHGGLRLGARGITGGGGDSFWGRGAGNTGAVGNFSARRFLSYDAARVTDALAYMVARKRDYPRNLSSDYQ